MKKHDKLAYFLPNTFTALNIACGFVAIILATKGEYYKACMLIFLGALFDSVDGRVARMTGTQSTFGEQFDSLSDLVSFGFAPSLIFYFKFLAPYSRFGIITAFAFLLCGALRLARFNSNIDKVKSDYFQGLPIPGAASAVVGFILMSLEFPQYFNKPYIFFPYLLIYAAFMISNFPFPSFKQSPFLKKHKKKAFFLLIWAIASLFLYEEVMLFFWVSVYVFGSFIYALTHREKLKNIFDWDELDQEEELQKEEA